MPNIAIVDGQPVAGTDEKPTYDFHAYVLAMTTLDLMLKPSLIALWLSQLVVFVVYPRFAARNGGRRLVSIPLATAASAVAVYGLYATVQQVAT